MEKQRIKYRDAADPALEPPRTRAPNSVFALATPQPPASRAPWPAVLQVKYDRPLPALRRAARPQPFDATLLGMQVGGCIDGLTEMQARSMQKRARQLGLALERRRLEGGRYGVWRVDKAAERRAPASKKFPSRIG